MCRRGLIIGGFATSKYYYKPLQWRLQQAGLDVSLAHPGPFALNIWPLEIFLANTMATLESIDEDVFLIGHSLGGLQALYLADRFPEKVKRVYTIGTPIWGCGVPIYEEVIRTLVNVPENEILRFREDLIPRVASRVVTISCDTDNLAPSPLCVIPGAQNFHLKIEDISHSMAHLLLPYVSATLGIIREDSALSPLSASGS